MSSIAKEPFRDQSTSKTWLVQPCFAAEQATIAVPASITRKCVSILLPLPQEFVR